MVKTPVRSIVGAIADAAARWREPGFPPRQRAREAVGLRTGYAAAALDYAFDRLFGSLTRDAIEAVLTAELGSVDALDGFISVRGRPRSRALPIGRVCVISSRTTVGVAIVPALFALCAKCTVLVKDREDFLASEFFATVVEHLETLRGAIEARSWAGADSTGGLRDFDAIVAFGSDSTLKEIGRQLLPQTRFIAYGSRASAGYVTLDDLREESKARAAAAAAALDLTLYESEGCLSLHALFVEREATVTPQRFGEQLGEAIAELIPRFPPAARDEGTEAKVAGARDLTIFRRSTGATMLADAQMEFLVAVDPPADEPPLFLPRVVAVRSVDGPQEALAYLQRHAVTLEALAVSERRDDIVEFARAAGASRITTLGALQSPPLGIFHGGRPRVAEFVRWMSDET
ncbi:MAG TPA: acyl-CoA reductase [Candidatus Baltobacteraceae bacterium]|jgi:hypothetical protein|nr:acyl-CoA reductase [Candidatus Baltobacteraceae bacterium]